MTDKVHAHTKAAIRKLSAGEQDFLDSHPLFGQDAQLPRSAALIKDLAKQVGDGLITAEEGDELALSSVNGELSSFPAEKRQRIDEQMSEAAFDALLNELVGEKVA